MTLAYNLSQLANYVNSSGQVDAATGLTNTSSLGFPTGTLMLFQQTSAPTGWTKQTTHNNKALRVVSGTASSGGTNSFTTVFADQTPIIDASGLSSGATTLSTSQIPSHNHSTNIAGIPDPGPTYRGSTDPTTAPSTITTSSTGGGGSHSHTLTGSVTASAITLNVQYVDLIIASKN